MDASAMETAISGLESMPGFFCQEGINRIFGNKELYCSLIVVFFDANRPEAIRRALQDSDLTRAASEAHALKGAALNMGFNSIAEFANTIGASLKEERTDMAWAGLEKLEELFARAGVLARALYD